MKRTLAIILAALMLIGVAPSIFAVDEAIAADPCSGAVIADGAVSVRAGTTANELLALFENKATLTVTDAGGEAVADGASAVGSGFEVARGDEKVAVVVPGDVNGDAKVNVRDVIAIMKTIVGTNAGRFFAAAANVAGDDAVNAADVIAIMKNLVGCGVELSPAPGQTAESEDDTLVMYFDEEMHQVGMSDTTVYGAAEGVMRLARREREDIQIVLTSESAKDGLSLEIGELKNADGAVLQTELYYGYYFQMVKFRNHSRGDYTDTIGDYYVDALPMYEDGFSIGENESRAFYLTAISEPDTAPGWYAASVRVLDAGGNEIKKSTVRAYVWDFVLDEAPASATAFGLSRGSITAKMCKGDYSGVTGEMIESWYKEYYDFLLDNHISCYGLPYSVTDERADAYMSDPRVTSFMMGTFSDGNGGEYKVSQSQLIANYNKLKTNPIWFDKSYYYDVDEPCGNGYELVRAQWNMLCELFPAKDFNVVVPWASNEYQTKFGSDSVDYCRGYLNIWCPQSYAWGIFHTSEERSAAKREGIELYHRGEYVNRWTDAKTYKATGNKQWAERYAELRAEGNKMWWYICCSPEYPYANFFDSYQGVNVRVVLWQQYMFDVDGLLYWAVNDWHAVNKKRTAGDGMLMYWGELFGQTGPVSSVRLTEIRDGLEDFQYLTQLERMTSREQAMTYVDRVTTAILDWNEDYNNMVDVRTDLGFALEKVAP